MEEIYAFILEKYEDAFLEEVDNYIDNVEKNPTIDVVCFNVGEREFFVDSANNIYVRDSNLYDCGNRVGYLKDGTIFIQ